MNQQIQDLLHKEMTRHEFLATLGFGVASMLGLSSILKMLGAKSGSSSESRMGYGASQYGR